MVSARTSNHNKGRNKVYFMIFLVKERQFSVSMFYIGNEPYFSLQLKTWRKVAILQTLRQSMLVK